LETFLPVSLHLGSNLNGGVIIEFSRIEWPKKKHWMLADLKTLRWDRFNETGPLGKPVLKRAMASLALRPVFKADFHAYRKVRAYRKVHAYRKVCTLRKIHT
jgi:hypothetical protein